MSCRYPAISLVIQTGDEDEIELESSALLQVAREADILSVLKNVEKTRDSVSIGSSLATVALSTSYPWRG